MTCKFRKLMLSWSKTSNRSIIERPRHTSSQWNPVDLISDKLCIVVNGERLIIFLFLWNCAMNYNMMFVNLKDTFSSREKLQFVIRQYTIIEFCLKLLSELHRLSQHMSPTPTRPDNVQVTGFAECSIDDITNETVGCVVFIMMYFHSLIFNQCDDQLRLY